MPNYLAPASFGSLELRQSDANEFIGQAIDYSEQGLATIRMMTINSLNLSRLDLIKIDVERMELEVLQGAKVTIERFRPIIIVEQLKASKQEIAAVLASYGYEWFALGLNFLAVHPSDPTRQAINVAQTGAGIVTTCEQAIALSLRPRRRPGLAPEALFAGHDDGDKRPSSSRAGRPEGRCGTRNDRAIPILPLITRS